MKSRFATIIQQKSQPHISVREIANLLGLDRNIIQRKNAPDQRRVKG